jgi:hypothetical protein
MYVRVVEDVSDKMVDGRTHTDLAPGKEYEVLCIEDGEFRLLGESNDPVLYPCDILSLIDPSIPSGWIFSIYATSDCGEYSLGPKEFLVPGFWEEYHDRNPHAISVFNSVRARFSP